MKHPREGAMRATAHRPLWYLLGAGLIALGSLVFILPLQLVTRDYIAGALTGAGAAILSTEAISVEDRRRQIREHNELLERNDSLEAEVRRLGSDLGSRMQVVSSDVANRRESRLLQEKKAISVGLFVFLIGSGRRPTFNYLVGSISGDTDEFGAGLTLWIGIRDRMTELGIHIGPELNNSIKVLRDQFQAHMRGDHDSRYDLETVRSAGKESKEIGVKIPLSVTVTQDVERLLPPELVPLFNLGYLYGKIVQEALENGGKVVHGKPQGILASSYFHLESLEARLGKESLLGPPLLRTAKSALWDYFETGFSPSGRKVVLGVLQKAIFEMNTDTFFGAPVIRPEREWPPKLDSGMKS